MDREYDIEGLIRSIIWEETKYLRHYIAKVEKNDDPDKRGKVFVTVPAIGWYDQSQGAWAMPRQLHSMSVPQVGEWVEVYFLDGCVDTLCYIGLANELKDMLPKSFDAVKTHVLFEGEKDQHIKYDQDSKQFDAKFSKIVFNEGTESFVKGDTAKTELDKDKNMMTTLQSAITGWTPVPNDGGAALKAALASFLAMTAADYSNILSTEIKGK